MTITAQNQSQVNKSSISMDSESSADDQFTTPKGSPIHSPSGAKDQFVTESPTLQAGRTYVIQTVSCGRMMTLLNGQVVLAHFDTLGCMYWACTETNGWLGLRNVASGKYLRHAGLQSGLSCSNNKHETWERLQIQPVEGGGVGHTLFMEHWGSLKPVGISMNRNQEMLDRLTDAESQGLAWVFFEAHEAKHW